MNGEGGGRNTFFFNLNREPTRPIGWKMTKAVPATPGKGNGFGRWIAAFYHHLNATRDVRARLITQRLVKHVFSQIGFSLFSFNLELGN